MVTLLNTSANSVFAGDLVEWTLSYQMAQRGDTKRARQGPRRVGLQTATVSSPKVIGRALSFAKPVRSFSFNPSARQPTSLSLVLTLLFSRAQGEPIDMLLKQ